MQLILDADNLDIRSKMSTIEQESLNEKFLTNTVIAHLADDIATGNKENIQKQDNIILDSGDDNVVDTDKEITISNDEIMKGTLNTETLKKDTNDSETVETVDVIEEKNIDGNLKQIPGSVVLENSDVSFEENNEVKDILKRDTMQIDVRQEKEIDHTVPDKNSTVDKPVSPKENNNEETSRELKTEKESDLEEKEVDISELSTELNKEKEMDLDKEVDITEMSTELDREKNIDVEGITEKVLEKQLENESVENEILHLDSDEKERDVECSQIEPTHIGNTSERSTAIEIDDDDEKSNEKTTESYQKFQENENKNVATQVIEDVHEPTPEDIISNTASEVPTEPKRVCRLSNNLDILSDEEDDQLDKKLPEDIIPPITEKQCINIDDDDDIMVIDEDSNTKDSKTKDTTVENVTNSDSNKISTIIENNYQHDDEVASVESKQINKTIEETSLSEKETEEITETLKETTDVIVEEPNKMVVEKHEETDKNKKPLLPTNFINTCKKNLSEMTRNDLEEFCILKIVESIVDRSNLGEIKAHLKNLTQTMEECKKKCLMLSKQNKDLQIVLKSVQEEQKSGSDVHITPLKITRSVGMQVMMVADKTAIRKKPVNGVGLQPATPNNNTKLVKNTPVQNSRAQKEKNPVNQQIPVPRLVPATPPLVKNNQTTANNTATKQIINTLPNGVRNSPPAQKIAEKRVRPQAVTVDLTDDEPPPKLQNVQRSPINQPMRVLTAGPNLIPTQRFNQNVNSPRKVYIPISGPQAQNVRPGQTIMLKPLSGLGPRPRAQTQAVVTKTPQTSNPMRFGRSQINRHPAPLPDAMKQYQPPNWKSLPPAPDLKLSKVENGIVISWKIDGYQEDNHEEIASYQLYAYQETSSPPNTALWKKIGDVKALPLPMACTLTQFMAGYKYYFAVRAVDIRSRFGPFSLPGSILLLNKM